MGYLFLILSLFSGTLKGYCGKITGGITEGFREASLANALRMLMCVAIGVIVVLFSGIGFMVSKTAFLICLLSGVSTSFFVVSWLVLIKHGAYMMIDIFITLGIIVPILFGIFCFGEGITAPQFIGTLIVFVAVLIMCSYNNSIKGKLTLRSVLLLLLCGLASGFSDLSQKLLVRFCEETPISVFNLYTYAVSSAVLFAFFGFSKNHENANALVKVKKILPYIAVMSVSLFAVSFFKTLAARYLDASVLYPLYQGGCLILSSCMCAVFFKERLTPKCILGLCTAGVGIVILNLF